MPSNFSQEAKKQLLKNIADGLNLTDISRVQTPGFAVATMAKDAGIVIAFGASDDLCEFVGAWYDEVAVYEYSEIPISNDGVLKSDCDSDDACPYFKRIAAAAPKLSIKFTNSTPNCLLNWLLDLPDDIMHEKAILTEDDKPFTQALIFFTEDI